MCSLFPPPRGHRLHWAIALFLPLLYAYGSASLIIAGRWPGRR